jgi:hypothetical protein
MFRTRTSINACCLPLCTCLRVQVYIRLCAFFFMAILMLEQAASLHQVKDAPFSGATKGKMPSCPQHFFEIFQKIPTTLSRPIARERSFLTETRTRRKAKMSVCVRWRVAYSFRAPSANIPASTARRLASTSLVSGFHPIPFREHSSDRPDSDPKEEFVRPEPQLKLSPEPLEVPGAANKWLSLAV